MKASYRNFAEFYPDYLKEHQNKACIRLHFLGSCVVLLLVISAALFARPLLLLLTPLAGYGCAWIGHFLFEKNRPATFRFPLFSFLGDWLMFFEILRGKILLRDRGPGDPGKDFR